MKSALGLAAALLALTLPTAVQAAEDQPPRIEAALTVGSLGVGPEFTFRPSAMVGVRGSATFLG